MNKLHSMLVLLELGLTAEKSDRVNLSPCPLATAGRFFAGSSIAWRWRL